ncbi:a-factor receptor [Serendipita sp. 399]|nr:a-factor receptor [Serendipita sp. 399]
MGIKNMSYLFPAYPIICIISAILALLPIPAHYRAGNIGIIALGVWSFWGNVIAAVNTIYWHGNLRNPNPIWGDICQAYFSVMNFGLSSSTVYIQYTLWKVSRNRKLLITLRQGHRYDVVEDLGPTSTIYLTPVAFALYYVWDPVFCIIAIIFSILTYINIIRHRKEVANMFSLSRRHNASQYYRLLAITLVLTLIHLPLVLRGLIINVVDYEVYPWISWDDTHSNYMRIQYISRFMLGTMPTSTVSNLSLAYWAVALCGYIYFALYGTGAEALAQYKQAILYIPRRLGLTSPPRTTTTTTSENKQHWWNVSFFTRHGGSTVQTAAPLTTGWETGTVTLQMVGRTDGTSTELEEKLSRDETVVGDRHSKLASPSSPEKEANDDLEAQRGGATSHGTAVETQVDETEEIGF